MTPQEIINEIRKLPLSDRLAIKDSIETEVASQAVPIPEEEVLRVLFEKGVIGNIPDLSRWTEEDEDWEPIEFEGRPVSELIIEDRR